MDSIERLNKSERTGAVIAANNVADNQLKSTAPCVRTEFILSWQDRLFLLVYQNAGNWDRDKTFFSFNLSHETFIGDPISIETDNLKFPKNMVGKVVSLRKSMATPNVEDGSWAMEYGVVIGDFITLLYRVNEAHDS